MGRSAFRRRYFYTGFAKKPERFPGTTIPFKNKILAQRRQDAKGKLDFKTCFVNKPLKSEDRL
jgi:hypothetical protein